MPTIDITVIELDHLEKFRKLNDDEKEKINQIIDTYLKCKNTTEKRIHIGSFLLCLVHKINDTFIRSFEPMGISAVERCHGVSQSLGNIKIGKPC